MTCPCFAGVEQGYRIECAWEDITGESVIKHEDRYREYERGDISNGEMYQTYVKFIGCIYVVSCQK